MCFRLRALVFCLAFCTFATTASAQSALRHIDDATLRFMFIAAVFYGLSTFEGSFLAIRPVNSLSHYTDWTVGHVHSGALGWVAMVSIGATYHLIPVLWGRRQMYSVALINTHFWLSTIGTVLYIASMWVNGIMQGLMWRAYNNDGTLTYSFAESVQASYPGYVVRLIGGAIFLLGMLLMAWNTWKTVSATPQVDGRTQLQPA